ncbi:hypothetical protein ACMAY7_10640 [Rhodobacteraceae bacterium nBUS_24]
MKVIGFISSYDELARYLSLPRWVELVDIVIIINHKNLIKYVKENCDKLFEGKIVFYIDPCEKKAGPFLRYFETYFHLRNSTKNILENMSGLRLVKAVLFTDMMNGYTLFVLNKLKCNYDVETVLVPTLVEISRASLSNYPLKDLMRLTVYRRLFGVKLELVKTRNRIIQKLSPSNFDKIIIYPSGYRECNNSILNKTELEHQKSNCVLFMTQPLLKNNRVSLLELKSFYFQLRTLSERYGLTLALKLHPNDSVEYYDAGAFLFAADQHIPSQRLDVSQYKAIMTFSSSSVIGSVVPVISCINLIEFIDPSDRDAILGDFLKTVQNEAQVDVVKTWKDLEDYFAKITSY